MNALGRAQTTQVAHQRGMEMAHTHTHAGMLMEERNGTHTYMKALGGEEWHTHTHTQECSWRRGMTHTQRGMLMGSAWTNSDSNTCMLED